MHILSRHLNCKFVNRFPFGPGLKFLLWVPFFWACDSTGTKELKTVDEVDLNRYQGKWYEIASFPNSFQKGCACTTAEYTPINETEIRVMNTCQKGEKVVKAKAKAKVVAGSGNSKLKVSFFWPFYGDYYIIALDKDYDWAVVSHPSGKYLWILSRSPEMSPDLYPKILQLIKEAGLDTQKLVKTTQVNCKPH